MRSITVVFLDEEHKKLKKKKGSMNWHDFIMTQLEDDKNKSDVGDDTD